MLFLFLSAIHSTKKRGNSYQQYDKHDGFQDPIGDN